MGDSLGLMLESNITMEIELRLKISHLQTDSSCRPSRANVQHGVERTGSKFTCGVRPVCLRKKRLK